MERKSTEMYMMNKELMQVEQKRQSEQWTNTENVVQGHVFNGEIEESQLSIYDFMMKTQHEIISFKMCDRLAECWLS